MLFTRCPDCETTFRITADALRKADGQVRCGRCACVFNAFTELRRRAHGKADADADTDDDGAPDAQRDGQQTANGAPVELDEAPAAAEQDDANIGGISYATVISELKASAAVASSEGGEDAEPDALGEAAEGGEPPPPSEAGESGEGGAGLEPGGAREEDDELSVSSARLLRLRSKAEAMQQDAPAASSTHAVTWPPSAAKAAFAAVRAKASKAPKTPKTPGPPNDSAPATPAWVMLDEPRPRFAVTPRQWAIACIAAGALLLLQIVHHYRSDLAGLAGIGPLFQSAYAVLGSDVVPHFDPSHYEILNWDAVADPSTNDAGNLRIAARIRNNGSREQPLPHVHVQLKDRWDGTLGSRVFAPDEYLKDRIAGDGMMRAGRTIEAQLDIFDPGREAYGFELDVCVDAQDGALRCTADDVFR